MKTALLLFELISRLKVNLHKHLLIDINVDSSWLNETNLMLGMPIGDKPRK